MTSHRHPAGGPLHPSGRDLPREASVPRDPQWLRQLQHDLRNHQTVLALASEALARQPTSDSFLQQRLHRMQTAIVESHQLLETLLVAVPEE